MGELMSNGVQIYQFPGDDETVAEINTSMNVCKQGSRKTMPKMYTNPPPPKTNHTYYSHIHTKRETLKK